MPHCILVVDDNEDNLELLSEALGYSGYDILKARDGQEAIDQALTGNPDLILLDMSLPIKSGWEVATELRQQQSTKTTPIIAITAHVLDVDRQEALNAGCNLYLTKPMKPREIIQEIETLLESTA